MSWMLSAAIKPRRQQMELQLPRAFLTNETHKARIRLLFSPGSATNRRSAMIIITVIRLSSSASPNEGKSVTKTVSEGNILGFYSLKCHTQSKQLFFFCIIFLVILIFERILFVIFLFQKIFSNKFLNVT